MRTGYREMNWREKAERKQWWRDEICAASLISIIKPSAETMSGLEERRSKANHR